MKKSALVLSAILFGSLFSGAANAAPLPSQAGIKDALATRSVEDVRHRPGHVRKYRGHRHFHPGRRYRNAPGHWHRYSNRPYNWRTRGCIIVGPVWFCP